MIKKLRIKFILISMLSIFVVLFLTIMSVNLTNYHSVNSNINQAINAIVEIGPKDIKPGPGSPGESPKEKEMMQEHYFVVDFDNAGNVVNANYQNIFSVSDADALTLATKVYQSNNNNMTYNDIRCSKLNVNNVVRVVGLDTFNKFQAANDFLKTSILISSIAYLAIILLIILLSKMVFRTSEESYRKQKMFITNASHELKTPLTVINTDLDIIELDNGKSEWSVSIRDQVTKLTRMTNQLVTLARLDEQDVSKYPFEEFDLSKTITESCDAFTAPYKAKSLVLVTSITPDISYHGNAFLIDELMYILLDNALKYSEGLSDKVEVNVVKNKKGKIEIKVTNEINDVKEVNTSMLFERFYRSDNVSNKPGSGIGLSIAKEIVKLHKGDIKAETFVKDDDSYIAFVVNL